MNVWLIGATVLLGALVPCGIVILRAGLLDALVGLTLAGTVSALALLLIAEGFHRNSYFTLPLVLAFTNFVSVMIFVRYVADLHKLPDRAAPDDALRTVGMLDAADRRVDTFSKGMRQRTKVAAALE